MQVPSVAFSQVEAVPVCVWVESVIRLLLEVVNNANIDGLYNKYVTYVNQWIKLMNTRGL